MTHKELCAYAVKWLKRPHSAGGPGCAIAMSECKTGWDGEIPDAIGFRCGGPAVLDGSVLVEVKASRADFLADAKKPHRITGGVGCWRYFMAPAGMIAVIELPRGWGLVEVNTKGHIKAIVGHACHARGGIHEYRRQAILWRFPHVNIQREQFLLIRTIANAGDPQVVLERVREANNRAASAIRDLERMREQQRARAMRLEARA